MKIVLVCLVLVLAINSASSTCSIQVSSIAKYKWSQKMTAFCEYNGMKLKPNSHFTDLNTCKRCTCSFQGLHCCGIGYYAGSYKVKGCAVVPDFCQVAVLNKNKTALCHP